MKVLEAISKHFWTTYCISCLNPCLVTSYYLPSNYRLQSQQLLHCGEPPGMRSWVCEPPACMLRSAFPPPAGEAASSLKLLLWHHSCLKQAWPPTPIGGCAGEPASGSFQLIFWAAKASWGLLICQECISAARITAPQSGGCNIYL